MDPNHLAYRFTFLWQSDLVKHGVPDVRWKKCHLEQSDLSDHTASNSLSVSFIQMLKAFHPVAILLISAAFRIQSKHVSCLEYPVVWLIHLDNSKKRPKS